MKQFKKVLAFVLALAMVVTAVPTADAKAAAKAPKLNNYKKILYVGQSYTLKVNNLPANWKKCTYAWSASNKNVTVKKGKYGQAAKVTAVKKGTATVTVKMTYPQTAAQKKAKKKTVKTFKCVVTVKTPSVKFTTTADRIEVGETAQFTAKAAPSTATITYSSSDAAVATVDATGLVTAVADGTATIKASIKVGNVTKTASKTVEVYTAPTEAKQTKVKEITITSGKVVTKDSKIEVKKGSVEVALAEKKDGTKEINIDATGKTVVLTTAAALTKGEYTVTIDGVTANFTAEDEKVTKIEFLGDKAVLDAQVCSTDGASCTDDSHKKIYKTATVAYKVYNQFNEDITGATNVEVSGNGATLKEKGTVQFESSATDGFRLNDIVAAVVIYNANGIAVTQSGTFTVSNESAVSEIAIKDGVYNKKGEAVTLTEDTDLAKDKVYVLVSAKDQYGRAVTSLTNEGNVYVQVAEGLTNIKLAKNASDEITVDGVKYAGFQLAVKDISNDPATGKAKKQGAGTATILVISKGTGITTQGTVTVANGSKIDTLQVQVPDLIVGGESAKLGYTAVDTYNKEVTSVAAFKEMGILERTNDTAADNTIYVKEDPATGKAELYFKAASNTATTNSYAVVSLLTKTYKPCTVNFTIQPNAVPKAIVGTDKLTTGALENQYFEIIKENIKVADQYGRTDKLNIDNYQIFAYFPDRATSNKAFSLASGYLFYTNNGDVITKAENIAKKGSATTVPNTNKVQATVESGEKESTTKVRFVLAPKNGTVHNGSSTKNGTVANTDLDIKSNIISTYDVTFTSTKDGNVKTYEVADIGTIYVGKYCDETSVVTAGKSAYNKTLDVKGVTPDGTKVKIPGTDYTVEVKGLKGTANAGFKVNDSNNETIEVADLETAAAAALGKDNNDGKDTAEITLVFTFEDGQKIEKKATISKEAPQVKEVKIKNGKAALELTTAKTAAENVLALVKAAKTAVTTAVTKVTEADTGSSANNAAALLADAKTAINDAKTALTAASGAASGAIKTDVDAALAKIPASIDAQTASQLKTALVDDADFAGKAASAETAAQTAYDTADGTIAGYGYTQIVSLLEIKDQYGVRVDGFTSSDVPTVQPTVTVSNAKDAAGEDVRTANNGKADTVFALRTKKATVTLTFPGSNFVFTSNVVSK